MSRGPRAFRRSDLIRALKAAKAAGVNVRVEIMGGKMVLETVGHCDGEAAMQGSPNPWDKAIEHAAHQKRPA
jgi:hypothetical protein